VVRQRLWTQYTGVLLLYHADAEVERLANSLTIAALAILAVATFFLVERAREHVGRRLTATIALAVAVIGLAAHIALQFMQDESWEAGGRLTVALIVFLVRLGSFLVAAPLAVAAYLRGQGRLAAVALALSLVLPALFMVWVAACGITDACFH
jgi:hypothetical protein